MVREPHSLIKFGIVRVHYFGAKLRVRIVAQILKSGWVAPKDFVIQSLAVIIFRGVGDRDYNH